LAHLKIGQNAPRCKLPLEPQKEGPTFRPVLCLLLASFTLFAFGEEAAADVGLCLGDALLGDALLGKVVVRTRFVSLSLQVGNVPRVAPKIAGGGRATKGVQGVGQVARF
jgi:hypothetical protein